ncbi:hypothetical protein FIBSPDRAFT_968711 [Athelia psychrophila]|uniref:Proliferating cell nuclear antigen PCNA N-terminal domain-containing protein n=1 Tax=Athelia psychrophila TaxID=1759441 RepID=A0A167UBB6_9AGAM|nr:hypothetical protein FIBSPDRAFT_968711 [Fibularhizoctonia sp. CBS 109695]
MRAKIQASHAIRFYHTAIKELVTDANFECTEEGINLQAMDNSHVALVSAKLDAFDEVLKGAKDDYVPTLEAGDDADVLDLVNEAKSELRLYRRISQEADDIDPDTFGIHDMAYDARVALPAAEFAQDLLPLGAHTHRDITGGKYARFHDDGEGDDGGPGGGGEEFKAKSDEEDAEDEGNKKKRQKAPTESKPAAKKPKKSSDDLESPDGGVASEDMNQHVKLTFSLKDLVNLRRTPRCAASCGLW